MTRNEHKINFKLIFMQIIIIFKNSENYFLIQCNLNNTINLKMNKLA